MSRALTVYRNPRGILRSALRDPVIATLGNFDGVHLGHRALLEAVQRKAHEICGEARSTLVVVSFYPHPAVVLGKIAPTLQLTTLSQKARILEEYGVDVLYLLRFTQQLAAVRAADFIEQILISQLNVQHLVIGPDARVGYRREGTPQFLVEYLSRTGRSVEIVPEVLYDRKPVRSGIIRELLQRGDVRAASSLLGRTYSVCACVDTGDARGRTLGFRTANLKSSCRALIPLSGVYATKMYLDGAWHASITNVGTRPTFGGGNLTVETHLLEYTGEDFYGAKVELHFIERIRGEQTFSSREALQAQIAKDVEIAQAILNV